MKIHFSALTAAALALLLSTACQREELANGILPGEEVNVTISAVMPSGQPKTRSDDNPGDGTGINRCILQVYMLEDDQVELYGSSKYYTQVASGQAKFENLTLITGYEYRFVLWADHVQDAISAINADLHYSTTDFPNIVLNGDYSSNDDSRDAFFGVFSTDGVVDKSFTLDCKLTRPFGQLNIFTTDYQEVLDLNSALAPEQIKMTFENVYTGMNLLTGSLTSGKIEGVPALLPSVTNPVVADAKQLSFDYIFAPESTDGSEYLLPEFSMTFYNGSGSEVMQPFKFNEIPVRRNYRTNVSGALLTDQAELTVTLKPDFNTSDLEYEVTRVESASDVQGAIESGSSHIQIGNETNGTVIIPEEAADDKSLSVVFNGTDGVVTVQDENSNAAYAGSISLGNASDEQVTDKLTVNLPLATVSLTSGSWKDVDATTAANTIVIGRDAEVETLTVKKGNVEIYGKVTQIVFDDESSIIKVYTVYDEESFRNAMQLATGGKCEKVVLGSDIEIPKADNLKAPYKISTQEFDFTLDLSGYNLNISSDYEVINVSGGASAVIRNGSLRIWDIIGTGEGYGASNYSALRVGDNGAITLEDLNYETSSSAVDVIPGTDRGVINIKRCSINVAFYDDEKPSGNGYVVATNASTSSQNVEITLEDSKLQAYSTVVLFNIPSQINIRNCELKSLWHAMILRGGTAVVENTVFTNENNSGSSMESITARYDSDWEDGNRVPRAALTIGNRGSKNYQYPTALKMMDCKVQVTGTDKFAAMYVYANEGQDLGVSIEYDGSTEIIGDVVYGSNNIKVNGQDIAVYEVSTANDIITAMPALAQTGGILIIEKGAEIDLSSVLTNAIRITEPTTITVYGKLTCVNSDVSLINESTLTINGTATSEVRMKRRVVENHGTLTVNGGNYWTDTNNGGTLFWNNSTKAVMTLNDVTANASFYCVAGNGRITINGGQLNSTASNKNGSWAYCISAQDGCQMNIHGAEINGVQGAIASVDGSYVLVDNVKATARNSDENLTDAFYALYAASEGGIEVLSGEYVSDRIPCCLASDNDVDSNPLGYFIFKGGKYSSMPQMMNKDSEYYDYEPYKGYKFKEITGDSQFKYEVVPE